MDKKHTSYGGRIVMIGCDSIGQGVLPRILRHIDMPRENIVVVTADERGGDVATEFGVNFRIASLSLENYRTILAPLWSPA